MLTWAQKKKLLYTISFLLLVGGISALVYILQYYKPPSCTDLKQNQQEEGIDCGGPCNVICADNIIPPVALWQRAFPLGGGFYNIVAYVENSNFNLGVKEAIYTFRLYDEENVIVAEKSGKTFIMPSERFAVFEPRIKTGERVPKYVFFEFNSFSEWEKLEKKEKPPIFVLEEALRDTKTQPRLDATIQNGTIVPIENIDVTAILYDTLENAVAVSATHIDRILKDSETRVTFTWPQPFTKEVTRIEIIPRIDLFEFEY